MLQNAYVEIKKATYKTKAKHPVHQHQDRINRLCRLT